MMFRQHVWLPIEMALSTPELLDGSLGVGGILFYNEDYCDADFNPEGVCIGYRQELQERHAYEWVLCGWNASSDEFKTVYLASPTPTHFMLISTGALLAEKPKKERKPLIVWPWNKVAPPGKFFFITGSADVLSSEANDRRYTVVKRTTGMKARRKLLELRAAAEEMMLTAASRVRLTRRTTGKRHHEIPDDTQ